MTYKVHPTAIVEDGVSIGEDTSIWDNAHIRGPARIGRSCIVGGKSLISYGVEIGDFVKINSFVYIPTGVTIERGAMISAGTIFTNDRNPRATDPDFKGLQSSGPTETTLRTTVGEGATVGAGCRIAGGIHIGTFAMIGMGSVVTRDVGAFHLVFGCPASIQGAVCRCGEVIAKGSLKGPAEVNCPTCSRSYMIRDGQVRELEVAGA